MQILLHCLLLSGCIPLQEKLDLWNSQMYSPLEQLGDGTEIDPHKHAIRSYHPW
jgi:hypothetical protein